MTAKGTVELKFHTDKTGSRVFAIELLGEPGTPAADFCDKLAGGLLSLEADIDLTPEHITFYWPGRELIDRICCALSGQQYVQLTAFLKELKTRGTLYEHIDSRGVKISPCSPELVTVDSFVSKPS